VSVVQEIQNVTEDLAKDDLNLELSELEAAAALVRKEVEEDKMVNSLQEMHLSPKPDDKDSDDSSSEEDDSSSEASSESSSSSSVKFE